MIRDRDGTSEAPSVAPNGLRAGDSWLLALRERNRPMPPLDRMIDPTRSTLGVVTKSPLTVTPNPFPSTSDEDGG
jgi:hypothetical protein